MYKFNKYYKNKYIIISTLVLVLGLTMSLFGTKFLLEYTQQQQQIWIEHHAETHSEHLQISITSAINSLSSISAFFKVQENINQDSFSKFVESDAAVKTGILALAWVPRITHEKRKLFETEFDKYLQGYRSITEVNGHGLIMPAMIAKEYFPIQHLFTNDETSLFIGLNMSAKPIMRENINKAMQARELFSTQPKYASQIIPERKTFQTYFPVYNDNTPSSDLIGFVMGLFDIDILVNNTFHPSEQTNMLLFDADTKKENQLIYKSKTTAMEKINIRNIDDLDKLEVPYWTRYFEVGNRNWLGVFLSNEPNTLSLQVWLPYLGLFLGLLITSLLSIYLFIALLRGKKIHNLENQLNGSVRLLTSQRSALSKQALLSKKYKEESSEKTRFLNALGHDLRQPLSSLGLYLAQLKLNENDSNKPIIEKTKLTLKSLNKMFESMLDMARLDAGTIKTKKMNIELNILFQSLQEEFELLAANKGLEIRNRCHDQYIYSDPVLLESILRNLLTNAIKFTEKGKILLASRKQNNKTIIYVMDTGQGIDNSKIEEIFRPYTRGDGISDEIGLGLGLAIVMHAVHLLGYDLSVTSKLDRGTCFRLIINKD